MSSSGAGDMRDGNNNDGNGSDRTTVPIQGSHDNQNDGDRNPSPPPQRPQPSVTSGAEKGAAKTARTPQRGGEEGSSSKPRKKSDPGGRPRSAPVFDGPETPPPCEVCSKVFPSWKSLFGHMRSHPERSWRGVKPPPVFTPPGSPERGDPAVMTLLQIGENLLGLTATEKEGSVTDDNIQSVTATQADFDLNDPMEAEEEEATPWPKRQRTFDLNMPAPEDDDAEDK